MQTIKNYPRTAFLVGDKQGTLDSGHFTLVGSGANFSATATISAYTRVGIFHLHAANHAATSTCTITASNSAGTILCKIVLPSLGAIDWGWPATGLWAAGGTAGDTITFTGTSTSAYARLDGIQIGGSYGGD